MAHLNPLEKEFLIRQFKSNGRIKLSDFCTLHHVSEYTRQSDISIKNSPISPEKCNISLKLSSKKCVIYWFLSSKKMFLCKKQVNNSYFKGIDETEDYTTVETLER